MAGLPKGGYGIVSRLAMRSDKVSKESKAVYALLCSYSGAKHYCYPNVETIGKDLGMSPRTVIRLTEELRAHGFVNKVKVANNKRKTAYIPLFPYGAIGDTDDIILEETGDTDDIKNGDMDGTLIVTENSNSISMAPRTFEKQRNQSRAKPKIPKSLQDVTKPIYDILLEVLGDKDVVTELKTLAMAQRISEAIDRSGVQVVSDAVRGRAMLRIGQEIGLKWLFEGDGDFAVALATYRNSVRTIGATSTLTPEQEREYAEMSHRIPA